MPYLYVGRGFAELSVPFADNGGRWQTLEYPVVIGYFAYGTAVVTQGLSGFPDLDVPISVNVNGCPNACARTQVADIGLKGQLVLDDDGRQVEGFQVHLGGGLGLDPKFGRKLRAHKVTSAGLDDYITAVVSNYLDDRLDGESFADWVQRADETLLRGQGLDRLDHGGATSPRRLEAVS